MIRVTFRHVRWGAAVLAVVAVVGLSNRAQADYAAAVLADGPIGYWSLNETTDSTAVNRGTLGDVADGEYFGEEVRGAPGPDEVAGMVGFGPDNKAIFLDWGIDVSGVEVTEPILDGLRAFALEGWVKPYEVENSNRAGLFGQDNAIEFGFIGPNDLHYWAELPAGGTQSNINIHVPYDFEDEEWHHIAVTSDGETGDVFVYYDGEEVPDIDFTGNNSLPLDDIGVDSFGVSGNPFQIGGGPIFGNDTQFYGALDEISVFDKLLTADQVKAHYDAAFTPVGGAPQLQAGDADRNLQFDQLDLVMVQIAAKYLTGQPATWGEGDWNGAPGGSQDSPPAGDGRFDQLDIIAAISNNLYLAGPYAALGGSGSAGDEQTSIVYNVSTGELSVDAPASTELTSINIDSASGIFTGDPAVNLGGSFDNDADNNIFKATFGGSFGSLSFGNVAQTGLSKEFVLNDLTAVGSLAGGGDLGAVDLIYIPEPSSLVLLGLGLVAALVLRRRRS